MFVNPFFHTPSKLIYYLCSLQITMSINLKPAFVRLEFPILPVSLTYGSMQPFTSVEDERLYRFHKLFAESYVTNVRNLEAPWKPVIASVLDAIVKKVCETRRPSIDIAVQQEQPLAPPALSAASTDANRTMTSSKHKGTVYPDVSVLRYLVADPDFRAVSHSDMGHKAVDYLVCGAEALCQARSHSTGLEEHRQGLQTAIELPSRRCPPGRKASFRCHEEA